MGRADSARLQLISPLIGLEGEVRMTVATFRSGPLKPVLAGLLMTWLAACAGRPAPTPPAAAAPSAPAQSTAMAETAPSPTTGGNFADWLQGVRQEAASQGISQQTLDA